jgi:hypothetical protein
MGWPEHDDGVFHGCEKFFRPGYAANLVSSWIPALDGVKQKLEAEPRSRRRLRKGCIDAPPGKGVSELAIFGIRLPWQIDRGCRESAKREGVADRVTFEVAKSKEYPGTDYDSVAVFDCLPDRGDPVGAAAHVHRSLSSDGAWMIVEPFANDQLKDNLNPVGRVYYSFSTLLCTPCSRSQEMGLCLGAQSGEAKMRDVVTSAGFSRFRRATETPFNIVYEARP